MNKIIILIFFSFLFNIKIVAQCPNDIKVQDITLPTCGNSNGKFDVKISNHSSNVEVSIDSGVSFYPTGGAGTAKDSINFTGLAPGLYHIVVRVAGSLVVCQSFDFVLRANYGSAYTVTPISSSNCSANGSIVLGGGVLPTDSVSWLSNLYPTFVTVGSLSADTIPNLIPGIYYVIFKSSSGGNYCYTTHTVTIGNTGTACSSAVFCGNATDTTNLFPNGTFGSGGNADGTNAQINGPPLPAGLTAYTYQALGAASPEDGFYAIANNTYAGTDIGSTPFGGTWYGGYDHDYAVTGIKNGYMMVVNASYDPDIVIQETVTNLCPNKKYQFSAFIRDLDNITGQIPANLTFLVNGVGLYTTGNLITGTGSPWLQVGFIFQPPSSTATISIRNNQTGGNGNDWALDDIYFGDCPPTITLAPDSTTCANPATIVTATITDANEVYTAYQWQVNKADGNGFINDGPSQTIPSGGWDATNTYTTTHNLPNPLTVLNNGWQYRIIVGTSTSDFSSATCYYTSKLNLLIWGCEVILPVKFIDITALMNNTNGEIIWQVADQADINHYELEKSNDGKNFNSISSIPANAALTGSYMLQDNNLFSVINYYRIKAVDRTGKYSYSTIVTLDGKGNTDQIKIYPNPVSDYLSIFTPLNTKIKNVDIIDAIGRTILQKNNFQNSLTTIDVSNLPSGFYNIKVINGENVVTNSSFIKK